MPVGVEVAAELGRGGRVGDDHAGFRVAGDGVFGPVRRSDDNAVVVEDRVFVVEQVMPAVDRHGDAGTAERGGGVLLAGGLRFVEDDADGDAAGVGAGDRAL